MPLILAIAKLLTIVGGLNWGLVGAFEYNLVDAIFGEESGASRAVYVIVGVAAVLTIQDFFYTRPVRPTNSRH